ncbi:unnamed protein product [Mycena citricolor]|uniref:Zn(2)-C6 fungal-type domain-containing protein n=2 Tax=Mycena citricolor TaxID=2018698 RepID=A0AAD2JZR2_9AGAR|nr:unnamed protein product [Mycena citricolor]
MSGGSTSPRPSSRKKSCDNCVTSKTRCDLARPACSRCDTRGLRCHYQATPALSPPNHDPGSPGPPPQSQALPPTAESVQIGSRWLDALVPPPDKTAKPISPHAGELMARVLRSYTRCMLHDDPDALPPIIHPYQAHGALQPALAYCRSLLRMWESRAPGSEGLVRDTIKREMGRLHSEFRTYDHITLLGACQSFLLYCIFFFLSPDEQNALCVDTATIIQLQDLEAALSLTGLQPDSSTVPPRWEEWIVSEAKRRTLYTMYMFDNVFNYRHGTTSFVAMELATLPVPGRKALWHARSAAQWDEEYRRTAVNSNLPVLQDLWPDEDAQVAQQRRQRIDEWLATVDEFGMFLFTVTNAIYGVNL